MGFSPAPRLRAERPSLRGSGRWPRAGSGSCALLPSCPTGSGTEAPSWHCMMRDVPWGQAAGRDPAARSGWSGLPHYSLALIDATSAFIAATSSRLTDTPVLIDTRSVCSLTLNHNSEIVGPSPVELPSMKSRMESGGDTGDAGGSWTFAWSSSVAMISETPSGGRTRLLVWIGSPGSIDGAGRSTFEICVPTADASPFVVSNGTTLHPTGTSAVHPAGSR